MPWSRCKVNCTGSFNDWLLKPLDPCFYEPLSKLCMTWKGGHFTVEVNERWEIWDKRLPPLPPSRSHSVIPLSRTDRATGTTMAVWLFLLKLTNQPWYTWSMDLGATCIALQCSSEYFSFASCWNVSLPFIYLFICIPCPPTPWVTLDLWPLPLHQAESGDCSGCLALCEELHLFTEALKTVIVFTNVGVRCSVKPL